MPYAATSYLRDTFTDTKDGRRITCGLAHFINVMDDWDTFSSKLMRFECDLGLDLHDPEMKQYRVNHRPDVYYRQRLSRRQLDRISSIK